MSRIICALLCLALFATACQSTDSQLFVQKFPFDGALHKQFRDAVYGPYKGEKNIVSAK